MSNPRQAVILIHGIGEQRPMETLRGFVDGVLDQQQSTSQADAAYYSKPDMLSDNFELRRLVSAGGRNDRTDFFEFYWAHLMPTATWGRLAGWYFVLMRRSPLHIPLRLIGIWLMSWGLLLAALGLGIYSSARFIGGEPIMAGPLDRAPWLILAIAAWLSVTVRGYVGDAAVYLSPNPKNIAARQKIRATGLALLEKVLADGRYDRIVVVGHSLGSVIGYDVLTLAWQRRFDRVRLRITDAWGAGQPVDIQSTAITDAERLAKVIRNDLDRSEANLNRHAVAWQEVTRVVAEEQARNGDPWPVTDFVTVGSPMTYAEFLLSGGPRDFVRRTQERELPHCPPVRELSGRFSFEHKGTNARGAQKAVVLNSAALFAATAWTNLYFKSFAVVWGDIIGGPVAPVMWGGVKDVRVRTWTWLGFLAHTHYWRRNKFDGGEGAPLVALRAAIALRRPSPQRAPRGTKP